MFIMTYMVAAVGEELPCEYEARNTKDIIMLLNRAIVTGRVGWVLTRPLFRATTFLPIFTNLAACPADWQPHGYS